MTDPQEIKSQIHKQIQELLSSRIVELSESINSIKESRDNESKSSAGDKYETGRAMMQIELDKNQTQLNNTLRLQQELAQIDLAQTYERVAQGSLVTSNQENYFISVGIGKIELGDKLYYAISLASPIGQALKDHSAGDTISFQGRNITIKKIV